MLASVKAEKKRRNDKRFMAYYKLTVHIECCHFILQIVSIIAILGYWSKCHFANFHLIQKISLHIFFFIFNCRLSFHVENCHRQFLHAIWISTGISCKAALGIDERLREPGSYMAGMINTDNSIRGLKQSGTEGSLLGRSCEGAVVV